VGAVERFVEEALGGAQTKRMELKSQYLVISRGRWASDIPPEEIQKAIDQFYIWLVRLVDEGKMKTGQRLGIEGKNGFR